MKILKANIQNFLTVGNASMELSDRGLLLIVGENADDSSANSNGAGKSSLVDAICWALYGVTARDVTGDDVVNESAKKDCCVSLTIEDGGALYEVVRHRKHKPNKNALMVFQLDEKHAHKNDLTKGTDKETQEVVNGLVGCSVEVFTSAVYAGQERMPDLPSMTDKSLKVLIEEAAGIQVLEEAHTVAKKRLGEAKDSANCELSKVTVLDNAINNTFGHLSNTQVRAKEFDEGKRGRAKDHLQTAAPHFEVLKQKASLYEITQLETEIMDWSGELGGFAIYQKELDELMPQLTKLTADKARASANYNHLVEATKRIMAERDNATALIGTPCKECGKGYCEDDMHEAIDIRKQSIDKNKAHLAKLKGEYAEIGEACKKVEDKIAGLKESLSKKSTVDNEIRTRELRLRELKALEGQIKNADEAIARIKAEAQAMLTQENPFTAQIAELEAKKADYEAKKTKQQAVVEAAMAQVELCEEAVKVFGPAGVRAHILDTVTPFLNARTNDYLGTLSDGNVHATWTTLTNSAKGEAKEKFSIAVSNDKGGSSFKKLSGGEKRKVRLATAMALQDLVASRATKPVQLFIADEIDYALDDSGLERLMGVLERKARERGTVMIISHQSGLRDWCDQVITVTKGSGLSTVSGDNMRTAVAA